MVHYHLPRPPVPVTTGFPEHASGGAEAVASERCQSAQSANGLAKLRSLPVDVRFGGPRFGIVVSKAVGNAVARHATSRRLRAAIMEVLGEVPTQADVVVRALPPAAHASCDELLADLRSALRKVTAQRQNNHHQPRGGRG